MRWRASAARRGPDLTAVGARLTRDQLIDQVSNGTPGGGNMPAYGKQMRPAEMTALADFLSSLRPAGVPAAKTADHAGQEIIAHGFGVRAVNPIPRRLSALLAVGSLASGRARADRRGLRARLAFSARPRSASLACRETCRLSRRAERDLPGAGVADRAVLLFLSPGSHVAALAANDGGAAAALAGCPMFPLLRGLPEPIRIYWIAPLLRSPLLRGVFTRLTHPLSAWLLFVAATWFWHLPRVYELALRSDGWHYVQHVCFLGRRCCSGIPSCGPIRVGRAGRFGCWFRTCFWPTCKTQFCRRC